MASSAPSFKEIRQYLLQFGQGEIYFCKNDDTGICYLGIKNIPKRNAITGRMMVQFRDCIEELERWEHGQVVIIHGFIDDFCSGGDLDFAKASAGEKGGNYMSIWMQDALNRLQKLPIFSVALIEGHAIGGGAEIAVSCDYIIVTKNARVGFVHARMGLTTAWGGTTRLVDKIGKRKALDILLTAKVLSAEECLNIGLADQMVPFVGCQSKVMEFLHPRIQHNRIITRAYKSAVANTYSNSFQDCLAMEKKIFVPFWGGDLNLEALNSNIKHA